MKYVYGKLKIVFPRSDWDHHIVFNNHENYITLNVDPIKIKVSVFLLLFYISQTTSTKLNVKSKYGYMISKTE
jgi:hypothetical protein